MTTPRFNSLTGPTAQVMAAVKRRYCAPPTYAPAEPVIAAMACPRCNSRINFTVTTTGRTSGRCVAACIKWTDQ